MRAARRRHGLGLALLCATSLLTALALARPGGGHSYSGGSRSSGGGGGGGGGGGVLFELLFYLLIQNPSVGIPLILLAVVVMVIRAALQRGMKAWSTSHPDVARVGREERRGPQPRRKLEQLRESDPDFSLVLFEDFVYMLYAAVHRARAHGTQPLGAYLDPGLGQALVDPNLGDVQGIVIGAMRYVDVVGSQIAGVRVELELEANFVEVSKAGQQQRYYVVDRLVLTRGAGVKSRPFARARKLDCPNCGAPLEALHGTQCSYCQKDVGYGRFDWMVLALANRSRELRGPLLTSNVAESGTELPTIADSAAAGRFHELQQRDPGISWEGLMARVALVFGELQAAWSAREPLRIRPYVSDNLFQSLLYWIDLYVAEHCRNVTENARILRVDLASVTSDAHYDAITVRLFATSVDYTVSDDGKLLSGSRSRMRTYSEYWTWIRGSARRGQPRSDPSCPNCGAPLKIGMAGNCEYCKVKVTSGDFDWVLSRIEQDDSYGG